MAKITKTKSRAGKLFVVGCWLILILIGIGYLTSDNKPTRTENAPAASQTSQPTPEKPGLKQRDLTEKDRKIIGECARHIKTLENQFLEFRNTETFREDGFSNPLYKEWQTTLERVQKVLNKAHEGYVVFEYTEVYAAACYLYSTSLEAIGKRKPNYDAEEQKYLQMIDEQLEPYLEW